MDEIQNNDQVTVDENAALDSVSMNKVDIIGQVVRAMNGMTINDLSDWYERTKTDSTKLAASIKDSWASQNKNSVDMKGDAKKATHEEFQGLFEGSDLSEEARFKLTTLFESAVSARLAIAEAEIEGALEEKYAEEFVTFCEEMIEKTEAYLEAAATAWVEENQVAIESVLVREQAEDVLSKFKEVLSDAGYVVPDEQADAFLEMEARLEEVESRLNSALEENFELSNKIARGEALAVFEAVSEGLTIAEKNKFKTLVEDIDVDENLEEKLLVVREANFKGAVGEKKSAVSEEVLGEETVVVVQDSNTKPTVKVIPEDMKPYVSALQRLA